MAEDIPPLVLVLRAKANELFSSLKEVNSKVGAMEEKTTGATGRSAHAYHLLATAGKAALTGIIGASVTVGVASVKMAGDFQEATTQLVTGAGESEKNIDMVRSGLLKMAGQVGVSANQLAQGMYLVESAGFHGAQGLQVMKAAAEGAKVGAADMASVSDGLTSVLNAYHMSGDKAVSVTNQLIATVANGKMHMDDLSRSLGNVVPIAAVAGIKFTEVGAAMATMTGQGMSARRASMNLAGVIRALANPSVVAQKEMEALGVSSIALGKNFGKTGLSGSLDILVNAIKTHMGPAGTVLVQHLQKASKSSSSFQQALAAMTPTQQTYIAALSKMVGGAQGLQAALLLSGSNAHTFKSNIASVSEAAKHVTGDVEGWKTTQADFNTKIAQTRAAVEAMGIKLGMLLIPKIEQAAQVGQKWAGWLQKHTAVAYTLAAVIGGVLGAAIAAYIAHLAVAAANSVRDFGVMIKSMVKWVAENAAGFAESAALWAMYAAENIAKVATVVATNVVGAATAAASWISANAAMLLASGGILLALGALVIGVLYLAKHWKRVWSDIKQWVKDGFEFVKKHLALIVTVALGPLGLAALELAKHWKTVWADIKAALTTAWNFIHNVFQTIIHAGLYPIREEILMLREIWTAQWNAIRFIVQTVWGFLSGLFRMVVTDGLTLIIAGVQTLQNDWNTAWAVVKQVVQDAWNFVKPIFDSISSAASAVGSAISAVSGAAHAVTGGVGGVLHHLGLASGGWTQGSVGQPYLEVIHGGEYMLSHDMLNGRQPIDQRVVQAVAGQGGGGSRSGPQQVTVNAVTNASPGRIAAELGWVLRLHG